jgi:type IV secretory pathway TraG/TraD family ATPase VirD4
MGYVGRAYDKGASNQKPMTIIIDEFAEFAIPEFPSFLNRVRGAGIGVVIAHQTRGDLEAISPDFKNKIESNTNTKIVAGVTDPEDAQFYAQMIGTRTVTKETRQVEETGFFIFKSSVETGMKSVRDVEEFIIHPNRIKQIVQGEALVISRTVDTGFGLVRIEKAQGFEDLAISRDEIERGMRIIRSRYMESVATAPGLRSEIEGAARGPAKNIANLWE